MKRIRVGLILALFALTIGALFSMNGLWPQRVERAALFPHGYLRVGIDPSYPPFAAHVEGGYAGLDVDLGEALAMELGLPAHFVPLGYDGLYDALRTDRIDILLAGARVNFRYSDDVLFSRPYLNGGLLQISPADAPLHSRNEIPGRIIAYGYGSAADRYLFYAERELPPFQRAPYQDEATALRAMQLGEAAAALVDGIAGRLFLRENPGWQSVALTEDHLAIAMRRDRPQLHKAIDAALRAMWADGRLAEILARWL